MLDAPQSVPTLVTVILVAVFGPLAMMVAERVTSIAPAWIWRLAAFLCLMAAWAIAVLNDPLKTQVQLHPKSFAGLTLAVIAVAFLIVRSGLFEARPKLKARIKCLRVDSEANAKDPGLDCQFTISIDLRNDGTIATTVTGFDFSASWNDVDYGGRQIQGLHEYQLKSFRPSDIGSRTTYTDEYEDLFDFPLPCEITTTAVEPGWLRFFIRRFPLEAGQSAGLKNDVLVTLRAFDKKGDPHIVYKGLLPEGECGPIVKKEKSSGLTRTQLNLLELIDKGKRSFSPGDFYSEADYFESIRKFQIEANELIRLQEKGYIRQLRTKKDSLEGQLYIDRVILIEGLTAEGRDALKTR